MSPNAMDATNFKKFNAGPPINSKSSISSLARVLMANVLNVKNENNAANNLKDKNTERPYQLIPLGIAMHHLL